MALKYTPQNLRTSESKLIAKEIDVEKQELCKGKLAKAWGLGRLFKEKVRHLLVFYIYLM